jgi:hypothetical protein
MESKITIEIDFENGNTPIVQVMHKVSEDVRDKIVGNFIQHLDHTSISRWLRIEFDYKRVDGAAFWKIIPISSSLGELEEEARLMMTMVNSLKEQMQTTGTDDVKV